MARAFIIASFAGLAACFPALPAAAQNALGDGTALDANQQMGAGRVNRPGHSIEDELRFRNAIVTGNAPGGLSFRGDVGYTSPFEFRGELGSDTLFSYRRDSFYSGLAGMGIRGTEALQYQFALTTGSEPPPNLRGSLIASRSGMEPVPMDAGQWDGMQAVDLDPATGSGRVNLRAVDEASPAADQRGQALWTLRSTAAYDAERRFDPSMLTVLSGQDGQPYGLTASPLLGVTVEALQQGQQQPGQRPAGQGEEADQDAGPEARLDDFLPADRFETYIAGRQDLQAPGGLVTGDAGEADSADEHITNWRRMLDDISAQLQAAAEEGAQPAPAEGGPGAERRPGDQAAALPGREDLVEQRRQMLERLLDDRTVEALQEAPGEYETLWRPSAREFDAYTVHMRAGEDLLGEGRYFEAEERFTRALAVQPGDPLAMAGRVHAQLGAGLFVSAATNLRDLLSSNPEIIGARYSDALLPGAARRDELIGRMRAGVDRSPQSPLARQSALLLAYVGFQTDDRLLVAEGLEDLEAAGDSALATVLSRVWQSPRDRGAAERAAEPEEGGPQPDAGGQTDDNPAGASGGGDDQP